MRLSALPGILQNDTAPIFIDEPPFFDLLNGSKAAKAGEVIVQAAISYTGGLSGVVDTTHMPSTHARLRIGPQVPREVWAAHHKDIGTQ
jgi:hypothetical protein